MISAIGLLASLVLLIWLALRGINIVFASLLCSLLVIITSGLPLAATFDEGYLFGNLGAFTFAGKFFLLFAAGAMFGRVMGDSGAAASIAMALVRKLGAHRALWITVLASALLTYGGVVVFVVIFAMYPLGLRLLKEADIPKRLFLGALALGAGTFTLTALPGTPSIQNIIPTLHLGTDLYAAPWLGLAGGTIMFVLGMTYLEWQRRKAQAAGEGFDPAPGEEVVASTGGPERLPSWPLALLPLVLVIGTIVLPRFGASLLPVQIAEFAMTQSVMWPSIALAFGSLVGLVLFAKIRSRPLAVLGEGVQDAVVPLFATAVVIGFGGVVVQTAGFVGFASALVSMDSYPLLSMFGAVSTVSGITGSASGGLQIFMQTLAPEYLAMGIEPEVLHRLAAMAAGGFDSLPHCGAVVAMLAITRLSHRQAYFDVGVITVVIPVIATLSCIGLAFLF
ncbi:GntP family permease [Pontixanthobacter gangjinensis]|uniref:GntP family permease n=1 Tax=Pontixanthobacter gangjinensis TaxID=1028742 RepID=A0A6I4SJQ1_9SPHN|nr:SLC13 family permease [Pontixanthobacter gangjinensis]MXO55350.1 GntP family permease [Pontixanthobacter gangjinensis]